MRGDAASPTSRSNRGVWIPKPKPTVSAADPPTKTPARTGTRTLPPGEYSTPAWISGGAATCTTDADSGDDVPPATTSLPFGAIQAAPKCMVVGKAARKAPYVFATWSYVPVARLSTVDVKYSPRSPP